MATIAAQPFSGTYRAQPVASSFAFAVRHAGVYWYRGSLSDAAATLRADGGDLTLEGSARVESISIVEPAAMRAHLLGPEFFDAERHPEVTFRSTAVRLADEGRAEVDGELTIRGITCPVTATGHYEKPRLSGFGEVAGFQLRTSVDRREFGFQWQTGLPDGGDTLGWDVEIDIDLLLTPEQDRVKGDVLPSHAGPETNKAAMARLYDAVNSGDPEVIRRTIDELVEPDAQIRTPAPMDATGAQLLKELFQTLHRAFPDLHIIVEDLIAEGDKVVIRDTVTGTHRGEYMGIPPTGKSIAYNEIHIGRFVNGRIAETWGVVDVLSQMRQLGAIPA